MYNGLRTKVVLLTSRLTCGSVLTKSNCIMNVERIHTENVDNPSVRRIIRLRENLRMNNLHNTQHEPLSIYVPIASTQRDAFGDPVDFLNKCGYTKR